MKRFRLGLVLFLVALSLPLSYVLTRTYDGLRQEEASRLRFSATALFDAMEGELADLLLQEEGRPVDAYGQADTSNGKGPPAVARDNALAGLPPQPWLRGYLQNQPDGSFLTPLLATTPEAKERQRELAAFNTRFNGIRYQAPSPLPDPTPAPLPLEERVAAVPLKKEVPEKDKGYTDRFLYQTGPSRARSALARQKVRVETLTANQARKVTRQTAEQASAANAKRGAQEVPAASDRLASSSEGIEAEAVSTALADATAETAVGSAADAASEVGTGTDAAEAPVTADGEKAALQPVEISPFQALLVDEVHAFVFRRILIDGQAYRQGVVIDLTAFGQHLLATHFADQPLAQFTQLQLWARPETGPRLIGALGKASQTVRLEMERRFPRPFAFLQARLVCDEIPPSSARAPLRMTLMALAAVLILGLLAIYRSVNAQVALSQRRTQFASAVTHELKTPLTTIRMYIEMLEQGMAGDPARRERYFRVLDTETSRLGRLINNVLELSRLEKQQRPLTYGYGDLADVVAKLRAALGPQIEAAGFDFQVDNRLKEPFAYDAEVLVQILVNLIENSLKFGRDSARKAIRLTVDRQADTVRLAVADTGPGIPRGDLKRIFEDFYRAEDEMTRTTAGTGIGLALVKRFAETMAGKVTARNNPSGGCTITLTLPAAHGVSA